MALQAPRLAILRKRIFGRIYQNGQINLEALRVTLDQQLDFYLEHLNSHLNQKISRKDKSRILAIVDRNNQVADTLDSPEYRKVVEKKKEMLGKVSLGLVFCIDGRIPAIFLGGRFASHWEEPAAEIKIAIRQSDGKLIPESSELCESIRKIAYADKDLFEIALAHTSLTTPSHGCGAMAAKKKNKLIDSNANLENTNLKIIEEKTLPAISNIYNEFRIQRGFEPAKQVGISGLYDTDTFGVILNYDKKAKKQSLSTTDLTNKYTDLFNQNLSKYNLFFGCFKDRFTKLKYIVPFSQNVFKVTEKVLEKKEFQPLITELENYINDHYPNLCKHQKPALKFFLVRNIAFQYLTGQSKASKNHLSHPFAHHEEEYLAVSTRGITIGKFDPEFQGFSSTPADPIAAIQNIKTKLSIMGTSKENKTKDYILFICNPVNKNVLNENGIMLHKIMDANAELYRAIIEDPDLWSMIKISALVPVSILIDEDTREVLKILDNSAYI